MNIWKPNDVSVEPETHLSCWIIFKVPSGKYHLCGHSNYEGRVTSALVKFDADKLVATTSSGRVYRMSESTYKHYNEDAGYVLDCWLMRNGLTEKDIVGVDPSEITL